VPEKTWDFEGLAEHYDQVVSKGSDLYERYWEVLAEVANRARAAPGKLVLDIGTGTGNLALLCAAKGARVVGVDPSAAMLAVARRKAATHQELEFLQVEQPFLHLPFPDNHFHAVVSTYAWHHVPRDRHAESVREMLRVLRPGGVWAVGDLAFTDAAAEAEALARFPWLEEEYFPYAEDLRRIFASLGLNMEARQVTPVTWIFWAIKPPLR